MTHKVPNQIEIAATGESADQVIAVYNKAGRLIQKTEQWSGTSPPKAHSQFGHPAQLERRADLNAENAS